ncbi:MAG: DNA primase/helicase [Siphoviridae sp. ctjeG17]|nr:MAG: DNA primase/helicase [Siphoviridae sp. ctjeG17]
MAQKVRACITVDETVWNNFKKMYPYEASQMINEFMARNNLRRKEVDVDIDIEKLELQRKIKQKIEIEKEICEHKEQIQFYEELQQEKEKQKLEQEKKEISEKKVCSFCGDSENIKTNNGNIRKYKEKIYCYSCFMKQRD